MKFRSVFFGTVIASASSAVFASEPAWYFLVERPGYLYFADEASAIKSDQMVELEFLSGNLDSPADGEHILLRYRVDCAKRTFQMLSGRVFTDEGSEVPDLVLRGSPIASDVDTVSPGEAFYQFACLQKHRETRVDNPFRQIREARAEMYGDHVESH